MVGSLAGQWFSIFGWLRGDAWWWLGHSGYESIDLGRLWQVLLLLPVGLMQTWASVTTGYWYARSAEFLQTPVMQAIRWARVFGDTLFAVGALALVYFVFGLATGHSYRPSREARPPSGTALPVEPEPTGD